MMIILLYFSIYHGWSHIETTILQSVWLFDYLTISGSTTSQISCFHKTLSSCMHTVTPLYGLRENSYCQFRRSSAVHCNQQTRKNHTSMKRIFSFQCQRSYIQIYWFFWCIEKEWKLFQRQRQLQGFIKKCTTVISLCLTFTKVQFLLHNKDI